MSAEDAMWFENDEGAGRGWLGRRRRKTERNVRLGRRGVGKDPAARLAIWTGTAVVAMLGLWLACRWLVAALFSDNSRYQIAQLDIRGGDDLVTYFIRDRKGIREGNNLFSANLGDIRDEFLRQRYAARYRSMEISRILPDTLRVEVVERIPIARLGLRGGLAADKDGFVFGLAAGSRQQLRLPAIVGLGGLAFRPGDRLQKGALDAVTVLDVCDKAGLGRDVGITEIDVSGGFAGQPDDMRMLLAGGTEVRLWWPRKPPPEAALNDLRDRLLYLRAILQRCRREGRRLKAVNLTLESYQMNCTVRYD